MDPEQAGLFDLPEPPAAPERMRGGKNRETWTRTAIGDVTIVDTQALREAAVLTQGHPFLIGLDLDPGRSPRHRRPPDQGSRPAARKQRVHSLAA